VKVTISIFTIALVLLSGVPLMSSPSVMNYASARDADTQTEANANECDTGTNCAINSPQTQGDSTANSPINLQISKFNEDVEVAPEPPGGPPPQTCVECFTKFLTFREIVHFEDAWDPPLNEIGFLCTDLEDSRGREQVDFLRTIESVLLFRANVDGPTVDEVINCLKRVLGLTP
jgi:hypothetical protein